MNGLSLFTGSGIGELAFKHILPDYRTIGYVEWDTYCQSILRARIRDGILDDAPIFGDIRQFNKRYASLYTGRVDWLSGGFPCQPFSVAGRRAGEADERNMWPATRDAISIIRPPYVFLENVPGLLTTGYERRIFADLAEIGYDCEWDVVPAAFVGAIHFRERLWILAYATSYRLDAVFTKDNGSKGERPRPSQWCEDWESVTVGSESVAIRRGWGYPPEPVRMVDGIPNQLDRLRACGNGWVPQVVARILQVTNTEK